MDDDQAVQVADMVLELWPSPPMSDVARAFYAKALSIIPEQRDALRAVEALFVSERFRPPPGDVLDRALGLEGQAQEQWERLVSAANEVQAKRPTPATLFEARQALASCGYRLATLPLQHQGALHKARGAFVAAYVAQVREATAAVHLEALGIATAGQLDTPTRQLGR